MILGHQWQQVLLYFWSFILDIHPGIQFVRIWVERKNVTPSVFILQLFLYFLIITNLPIIVDIASIFEFHIRVVSISRSLYFERFSSVGIDTPIRNRCVRQLSLTIISSQFNLDFTLFRSISISLTQTESLSPSLFLSLTHTISLSLALSLFLRMLVYLRIRLLCHFLKPFLGCVYTFLYNFFVMLT